MGLSAEIKEILMSLRPDVEAANYQTMRINLYEEASRALPLVQGKTESVTVTKGQITARTVSGGSHYNNDIDSLIRVVRSDLSSARKFPVSVVAEKVSGGVKFTISS